MLHRSPDLRLFALHHHRQYLERAPEHGFDEATLGGHVPLHVLADVTFLLGLDDLRSLVHVEVRLHAGFHWLPFRLSGSCGRGRGRCSWSTGCSDDGGVYQRALAGAVTRAHASARTDLGSLATTIKVEI